MTLGALSMLAQSVYPNRPKAIQLTFNVCAGSLSTALAYVVYHNVLINQIIESHPLVLCLAASTYFIVNAGSIAVVISVSEGKPLREILVGCYFWSFPYYLLGAGISGAIGWFSRAFNWETSLLFVPAMYIIYRSYRLYLGKLGTRSGMWRRLRTCICELLKPWLWPSKPKTRPPTITCRGCASTPSR
jgi:hypothetical protein